MNIHLPRGLRVFLLLALALSALIRPSSTAPIRAEESSSLTPRWIVHLEEPPLVNAPHASIGSSTMADQTAGVGMGQNTLDTTTPAAEHYRNTLKQRQTLIFNHIQRLFPAAEMHDSYQIVFNGMSVAIPGSDLSAVKEIGKLDGVVGVYPERGRELDMYASVPMIGADVLWNRPSIGGKGNAGAGIKIAIIDSGIKIDNPFFNPSGYTYPPGYPKGNVEHTTPKVIAARAYFRPDLPPVASSTTPQPGSGDSSHGSHVAGIAAGVADTTANVHGVTVNVSGVAPRAYLMNYKAFYKNDSIFSGTSFETELIAAIEDAVADGADVINNSWGGRDNIDPRFDPIAMAANGAAEAGVSVVFSAGNSGPYKSTADSGDFTEKLLMVGATTTNQTIAAGFVDVTGPDAVPPELQDKPYGGANFGPSIKSEIFGPAPYVPVTEVSDSSLACDPLPANSLLGKIALVERGNCYFSTKAYYAQEAGAIGTIVYNTEEGGETIISMDGADFVDDIVTPAVFVQHSMGVGMIDWYYQHPNAAQVQIDPTARMMDFPGDVIALFSSRGPTFQNSLKPDVVAPGINILSAGFANAGGVDQHLGFGLVSGTSMAAPQVAGSVALLRQAHPEWSPLEIKSALMSTANAEVWLDAAHTRYASVLARGAGRVDLARADNPGIIFDRPALSFGPVSRTPGEPTLLRTTVGARNITNVPQTLALSANPTNGPVEFQIHVAPYQFTVEPNAEVRFDVTVELPADAPPEDYEGLVYLNGGPQPLHLPLWVRALPTEQAAQVLLIDNDGSSSLNDLGGDMHDYADYYINALENLGVTYTYLDVDAQFGNQQTLPDIGALQQFKIVLWFTGDNYVPNDGRTPYAVPLTETDQNLLIAYLQSGGNLIATGQDLSDASDITVVPADQHYGRSDLYHYYLGARYVQDNVFDGTWGIDRNIVGTPTQSWLANITLDLSFPTEEGLEPGDATSASNQESIDEITLMDDDPRSPDRYTTPILKAASRVNHAAGIVGMNRSSSPTLEQPLPAFHYRTTFLTFGLEGVRSDTGATTMKELLQSLLYWHVDYPTVTVNSPVNVTQPSEVVSITAEASTNTPASFVRYRWDFGDGTPVVETNQAQVVHTYKEPGSYHVRVEATDSWGHRAISFSAEGPQAEPLPRNVPVQERDSIVFEGTGQKIEGRFFEFWQHYGGLAVFGLPISPQSLPTDDAPKTQTFERAKFEYHPENNPPYDVLLAPLGIKTLEAQGRNWHDFPKVAGAPEGCLYFAQTGHSLCDGFRAHWEAHGLEFDGQEGKSFAESLALFGAPISEPMQETIEGQALTVQWFERSRFEYHPAHDMQQDAQDNHEHDAASRGEGNVLLGRLGSDLSR